jgi:hypothetical protein
MKLNRLAATTAFALVVGAALPSTAFAAVDPIYGTDPMLDQACSDLQKPADNSGFTSFAENIQVVDTSTTTEQLGLLSIVGVGPSVTSYSNFSSARVNGQSVNIHALADKTVTYAGGAIATYQTKVTTTTVRQGTCHVHKQTEGNANDEDHPGYQIAPIGLQTTEPVQATSTEVTYGTTTVTIPGPWTDPNATGNEQVVICISPGKKPGEWRNQNGYNGSLGTCSRAWYDTLGSTPSVSLPGT